MPDRDIFTFLDEVIEERFRIYPEGNLLVIREKQPGASGQSVTLKTSGKTLAFSLDRNETSDFRVFPFFNRSTPGINSKNDAIIFCRKKNDIYALLVELKSGTPGKFKMQLRSGKNFLDFLVATINLHYPVRLKVSCRGLLFDMSDNRRIPKKNETRRKKVVFRNDGGLEIARLSCNEIYHLTRFLE